MQIRVSYFAQLKQAAGCAEECVSVTNAVSLEELVRHLASQRTALRCYLNGAESGSVVAFVNDHQRAWGDRTPLADGDRVTFLAPMAGG